MLLTYINPAFVTYIALAIIGLTVLTKTIIDIGDMMADCPNNVPGAPAAALTIATGFAIIGAGGILLIGVLPLLSVTSVAATMAALGFAALCLGLGFAQAVATLRAALAPTTAIPALAST